MSKKWIIDRLFEKNFSRYYKKSGNGKMELFGIDGANHGAYVFLYHIALLILFYFLGFNHTGLLITTITISIITIVFFFMQEAYQYRAFLDRHNIKDNMFLWLTSKNAQVADFEFPALVTTAISVILYFIL